MVRREVDVERVLTAARGRVGVGIMVETRQAVTRAASLAQLGICRAFVGLLDLAVERDTPSVFTALADGTVEGLVEALAPTAYGFGGLTDPERGHPLPARLLMGEIVRGGCSFAMMRNAFVADAARELTRGRARGDPPRAGPACRAATADAGRVPTGRSSARPDRMTSTPDVRAGGAAREPAAAVSVILPLYRTAAVLDELLERLDDRVSRREPSTCSSTTAAPTAAGTWSWLGGATCLAACSGSARTSASTPPCRPGSGTPAANTSSSWTPTSRTPPRTRHACWPRSAPATPTWCARAAAATTRTRARNAPPAPTAGRPGCSPAGGSPWTPACSAPGPRSSVDRVVALDDHAAPLDPGRALAGLRITTVPVHRHTRPRGRSATGSLRRVRIAVRGLVTLTPLHPLVRRLQPVRRRAPAAEVVELGRPSRALEEP